MKIRLLTSLSLKIASAGFLAVWALIQTAGAAAPKNLNNLTPADVRPTTPVIKPSPPPPPSQVMSSEAFKSTTSQMGQDAQSGLTSQLNNELSKQPPIPPQPEPTTKSIDVDKTNGKNASQKNPADSRLSLPTKPNKPAPESKPAQSNTYTGFGSGGSNSSGQSSTPSGSGNSGGWNVQY